MAQSNSGGIFYQALIQSNCYVFLGNNVDIETVTQVDASNIWTAHVVKTEHGKRCAVLSETGNTVQAALENLHRKTSQAVTNYVTTNGFDLPVRTRKSRRGGEGEGKVSRRARGRGRSPGEDLEEVEIISLCSDSSLSESEASSSDADSDFDDEASRASARRCPTVRPAPHMAVRPGGSWDVPPVHRPRVGMPRVPPPPAAYRTRQPLAAAAAAGPPPPPPPPPPSSPSPGRTRVLVSPAEWAVQQHDRLQPVLHHPQQQQKYHGMVLCVKLMGAGELCVSEVLPLSRLGVVQRAVQLARTRMGEFRDEAGRPLTATVLPGLDAVISKIVNGGVTLEGTRLQGFGDDLSSLFAATAELPRVEVLVHKSTKALRSSSASEVVQE